MNEKQWRCLERVLQRRWARLGLDALQQEERDYILLWQLNAEVSNGSFHQYLCNASGDRAPEVVAALDRLGSVELLTLVRLVLDELPGGWCADQDARCQRAAKVPDDVFRLLTNEYHRAIISEASVGERAAERVCAAYERERLLE